MEIQELQALYGRSPQVKALGKAIGKESIRLIALDGLLASSASVVFSSVKTEKLMLFVLRHEEEAGYFYHDLTQQLGDTRVLFFPSSYKRAIKYGQKDPANEILRTEVLSRLNTCPKSPLPTQGGAGGGSTQGGAGDGSAPYIVTYPEALA